MPFVAFSQEWVDSWAAAIRASDEYRNAARRWEWPLALVLRADPAAAAPLDRHVYLDLWRGECREARAGAEEDLARASFILGANERTWRDVLEGKLDPVAGIMLGKVKLEKGSIMTLAMHTGAAKALVATAALVDTTFPETP